MTATYPLARPSAFAANATNPLAALDSDLVNLTDTLNGLGNGVSVIATATITTASITNCNVSIGTIANASINSLSANVASFLSPLTIPSGGTGASTFANAAVVVITAGSMTGVLPAANGTVLTSNGTAWGPALVPGSVVGSPATNSIAANVTLINNSVYVDGPTVNVGSVGIWWASGTITLTVGATPAQFVAKLWDGTTVIDSTRQYGPTGGETVSLSLSGFINSPAGALKISAAALSTGAAGTMVSNVTGNSKDSTISSFRIA